MKMEKMRSIERNGEKMFRNFWDESAGYNDFSFPQYSNANGTMGGQAFSRMDPLARTYTLVITNSGATTEDVTILAPGAGTNPTFAPGTNVVLQESTYSRLLTEALQKPKLIKGIKVQVKDQNQLDNVWTLGYQNAAGKVQQYVYSLLDNTNSYQNIATRVEDPTFEFMINVDSFITIPVNGSNFVIGGERLVLKIFLIEEFSPSRQFNGQPTLAKSPVGFISGLPEQNITVQATPVALPNTAR
jgi:hypothetical protein